MRWLVLSKNDLTGSIPPELGSLANLMILRLDENTLTGSIPPELGALPKLEFLWLAENVLTGPIPRELGALPNLEILWLENNHLTGPIPLEFGSLANLTSLNLGDDSLTGTIPEELAALAELEVLRLQGNDLRGSVPPAIGGLENLSSLVIARNGGLSGALPAGLTDLRRFEELLAADTNLCAPSEAGFQDWLSGVLRRRVVTCGGDEPPTVVLIQAVQSRDHPVPLVADEDALLRVFVESGRNTGASFPPVRATFYRNGSRTHVVDIPGRPVPIPRQIDEGDLTASANAEIPGRVVQPGLEMVIDVDPEGTLGPDPGVKKRIPETGRLAVEVRTMPVVADGDGGSSFVFALPVQAGWAEELAGITLSGPGGSVRLDGQTGRPVTILRDPGTGEIRGILRGLAGGDDAVSALAIEPGLEVLTSRGIPAVEDWGR